MRRFHALVQLTGFVAALVAVLGTQPRRTLRDWSESTIYPSWVLVLVAVGGLAALVSFVAPARATRTLGFAAAVSATVAGPVAGLGVWAARHWVPAFGIRGGFAGEPDILRGLAFLVAGAGVLAAAAAVVQLSEQGDLPRAGRDRALLVGVGALLLLGAPLAIVVTGHDLRDLTSIAALVLVYGATWAVTVAASGWLSPAARTGAYVGCLMTALVSCASPSTWLTANTGRPAFGAVALVFALLLVRGRATTAIRGRASAVPSTAL